MLLGGFAALPATAQAAQAPPVVTAKAAILLDADSGRILYSRSANERLAIASTTKIMTALVVLESLPLDAEVTASERAQATDESQMYLRAGEVFTVRQLLHALLIKSANDAGVALAEAAAGSVESFAGQMNAKARSLGLKNTHFVNPHGLDAKGHYSSARDLVTLAVHAMENDDFRALVGTRRYELPRVGQGSPTIFTNHNRLLGRLSWITGVKTGYTGDAGFCLVASGTQDGISLMSVVLGQPQKDRCWTESEALLTYGFSLYQERTLARRGAAVALVGLPYHRSERLQLIAAKSLSLTLLEQDVVAADIKVNRPVVLPIARGEQFGEVRFSVEGKTIGSVPLVAARPIEADLRRILAYTVGQGPPNPWLERLARGLLLQL